MAGQTMQASEFKARCLAVLDEVARTRQEVVVTKHGVPVARLVPIAEPPSTDGSVTLLSDDDELYFSTGEAWDADA
jgi:prevent-host-death family protein